MPHRLKFPSLQRQIIVTLEEAGAETIVWFGGKKQSLVEGFKLIITQQE
jgi:hypothetical protein